MAGWSVEFADGTRSPEYRTLDRAMAALRESRSPLQAEFAPRYPSRPMFFVSSDGQRIPVERSVGGGSAG